MKGWPGSLSLVRNWWSRVAGSHPQPCTCCCGRGCPPQLTRHLSALSSVLLAGVPTPALPVSQAFVTLCLVKTSQHSLESVLITTTYEVNSAGFFLSPFPLLFWGRVRISAGMGHPDYSSPVCRLTGWSLHPRTAQVSPCLGVGPARHPPCPCHAVLSQSHFSMGFYQLRQL